MPETPTSPSRELQQLSLNETLSSPRTSSTYTHNINDDIQARLLAFQEQRQSKSNSPQDESNPSSPLHSSAAATSYAAAGAGVSPSTTTSTTTTTTTTSVSSDSSTPNNDSILNSSNNNDVNSSTSAIRPNATPQLAQAPTIEQQQQQIHELQRKRSLQTRKEKPLPPLPPSKVPVASAPQIPTTSLPIGAAKSATPHISSKLNPARPAPSLPVNSQVSPQIAARLPKAKQSLSMRRGMKLPGGLPGMDTSLASQQQSQSAPASAAQPTANSTMDSNSDSSAKSSVSNIIDKKGKLPPQQSMQLRGLFANYSKYIDIKSGSLNFAGKLSLDSKGANFNGKKFSISADDLEFMEELGRGNYGTVSKVLHKPTGIVMAMKEVRLELDDSKFRQILMELEVLHKCNSPYIVDFYGAFFVEGAVYMCIEYMDGGSLDKIYGDGVDEPHLKYITNCVVRGLKELKDTHNVIHRDVKPTNILVNTSGKVKLCDFGVSGNLVASLAKTNIGCQSYMAPERIKSLSPDDVTYTVQSDIWSLGLSMLETAKGCYPYPPETYDNIFSQLSAIVDGEPPKLPDEFSDCARDFVSHCLDKIPERRPTYSKLLQHAWLQSVTTQDDMSQYVQRKIEEHKLEKTKQDEEDIKELNQKLKTPALHRGGAPQA
ncbi:CYFA0S41e00276g1_1 [Cyberlindnera fabianii]|uniref:mitogen-activated protein kinase kinase n=1 Tax=Cyberlindnera fabianii TaxID=36022 RepID=A0A061BF25_CYBFA|nr:CYFA0S41e00276g1_1 [Cyberlindnera fabianii]